MIKHSCINLNCKTNKSLSQFFYLTPIGTIQEFRTSRPKRKPANCRTSSQYPCLDEIALDVIPRTHDRNSETLSRRIKRALNSYEVRAWSPLRRSSSVNWSHILALPRRCPGPEARASVDYSEGKYHKYDDCI